MRDLLKNMALFVDGRGYAGDVEEVTPPPLTIKTAEMHNGGMDAPLDIDVGMEKLETSFTLTKYDADVLGLWGLSNGNGVALTLRGSLKNEMDSTEKPAVINVRGRINKIDEGTWKPGEIAKLKITMSCAYYKRSIDGAVIHEIDIINMVRIVNGVDQLAQTRKNLGI